MNLISHDNIDNIHSAINFTCDTSLECFSSSNVINILESNISMTSSQQDVLQYSLWAWSHEKAGSAPTALSHMEMCCIQNSPMRLTSVSYLKNIDKPFDLPRKMLQK